MKHQAKFVALLLASASTMVVSQAYAGAAAPEVVSVTAADDQGGAAAGGNVGTIDVQGAGNALGSGYIVPEDGPKARSTVTNQGIQNLIPTANPYQAISILPGVNQFEDDAVGLSGGTIKVRGLRGDQMGFTVNGAPVNNSGNFAVYPNEYVDTENLDQIWVTQGSTDIDAPHVGASGGNIGIVTRAPYDTFNTRISGAYGDLSYLREFASIDSGIIDLGKAGTVKAFISDSHAEVDKWRGSGNDDRWNFEGNVVWQFLPHSSIGLTWAYNQEFDYFYRGYGQTKVNVSGGTATLSTYQFFKTEGSNYDYDTFWGSSAYPIHLISPTSVNNPNFTNITNTTSATNYWQLQINPFRNAVITAPLHVQLLDNLRWDTTAYTWLGDGGGGFGTTVTEGRLINGYQVPNGLYGDTSGATNSALMYRSSVTRTFRPGVESKLTYDWENYTFMGGIWREHAEHRQTQPYSFVNSNGSACDAWLTETNASNSCVLDGSVYQGASATPQVIQGRDFLTSSTAGALYGEVQGRYLDDALKVNLGLTYRYIQRSMHDYLPICATGESASSCQTPSNWNNTQPTGAAAVYNYFHGNYAAMQAFAANPHAEWRQVLPELNATFDIDPENQIFADTMKDFRTPSNFIFNTFNSAPSTTPGTCGTTNANQCSPTILELTSVKPEETWTYEAGYRFHGKFLTASATAFYMDLSNYQASIQLDPVDFSTKNIGDVKMYGIEAEAGTTPWYGFTFYGSATLMNSRIGSDQIADQCTSTGVSGCSAAEKLVLTNVYLPTRGKQLVDTPNWLVSASIGYDQDGAFATLTPHCSGERATAILNDEYVPAYCTVDASIGYRFTQEHGALKNTTLKVSFQNLANTSTLGEMTTNAQTNALTTARGYTKTGSTGVIVPGFSYTSYPTAPFFVGINLTIDLGH